MKSLPMHDEFLKKGAKTMSFGDWEVPAYCTSILDEHTAVRTKAGIFDISHMGVITVTGPQAWAFLQYLISNDMHKLCDGMALYAVLCNEEGGIIDDLFVYQEAPDSFFLIVNASNCDKDFAWIVKQSDAFDVAVENISLEKALFAVQGPASYEIIQQAFCISLSDMAFHSFQHITHGTFGKITIATTGYTGEAGCEIVMDRAKAAEVWAALMAAGEPMGLQPIGFGARDTLRLEACCLLYGADMDETTNPFEVGLGWIVALDGDDFIGKKALCAAKEAGIQRKIVCFKLIDKGIPRHGYPIVKDGKEIGVVTSGSVAPTVGGTIGFGLIAFSSADVGDGFMIEVRARQLRAEVVKRPFYKRAK